MPLFVKNDPKSCSACGLCLTVCKNDAIAMREGEDGFFYPHIDEKKCTSCNACRSICPFERAFLDRGAAEQAKEAYAYKHDASVCKASSSGGFFTALSDYVLSQNGVIYGAVFDPDFRVVHIRAEDVSGRDRMRGSKYVQSDLSEVYQTIREDVKGGRLVLFTGVPCQCAAIQRYIGTPRPQNLIVMDLICHGVMSYSFFEQYLRGICPNASLKELKNFNFRDKDLGWQSVSATFASGERYHSPSDYFYQAFATDSLQRTSCFRCPFAAGNRFGDFTVGDYWGIQKHHPDFYEDTGVSLVLVNTESGKSLLGALPGEFLALQRNEYIHYQPTLSHPTTFKDRSAKIRKYYGRHGYKKTMHRFFDVTWRRRLNGKIAGILKKLHLK